MIIKGAKSKKIYYDTGKDKVFLVTFEFWKALKAGEIRYRSGGEKTKDDSVIFYTERLTLDLKDKTFEKTFEGIARSEIGKLVMSGHMPVDTIL